VRFCASAGIRQFLDIGSGIPTAGNVHEIAPAESRVLYVDNEPVAVTHSELMLRDNDRATCVRGDLTDPAMVLDAARQHLDLTEPVAVLMVAVLHFIPDSAAPHAVVAEHVRAMAPGSYLVLSHGLDDPGLPGRNKVGRLYEFANTPGIGRSRADIERFFTGLDLVDPGLVWTSRWRPESPTDPGEHPEAALVVAGVGRRSPVGA
jgi:SAM-dependent methyltransferase